VSTTSQSRLPLLGASSFKWSCAALYETWITLRKEDIFEREFRLSALKDPVGTFVKDKRIAGRLLA
jgi:hypothetical protein